VVLQLQASTYLEGSSEKGSHYSISPFRRDSKICYVKSGKSEFIYVCYVGFTAKTIPATLLDERIFSEKQDKWN